MAAEVTRQHFAASGGDTRVEVRDAVAGATVADLLESLPTYDHATDSTAGGGPASAADGAFDDLSSSADGATAPFELIVWHTTAAGGDAPAALRRAAHLLAPHGVIVLLHDAPESPRGVAEGGVIELVSAAAEADSRLRVVTVPSPDGGGGLVSLVGLVAAAEGDV